MGASLMALLEGVSGAKYQPGFRPVTQDPANYGGNTRAALQQQRTAGLEGYLNAGIDFEQFVSGKKQSGLADVDGLPRRPFLLAFAAITQGKAQLMAHRAINHGSALFGLLAVSGLGCFKCVWIHCIGSGA